VDIDVTDDLDNLDDFSFLLEISIQKIQDHEDYLAFIAWAQEAYPVLFGPIKQLDYAEAAVVATWMARAVWNGTPLASHRYQPRVMALPGRNAPCLCGSQQKFKQCCRDFPYPPDFTEDELWPMLAASRSDKFWLQAAQEGRLPTLGILVIAEQFSELRRRQSVNKLADIAFGGPVTDPAMSMLVDIVCDAYDDLYKTDASKVKLLQRLSDHTANAIRAAANQRLTSWLHDQGREEEAWQSFERALHAAPNDPANAALELTLLVSLKDYSRAKHRADFWWRRLSRLQDMPSELLDLLRAARDDPARALARVSQAAAPYPLGELIDWVEQHITQPLPELSWIPLDDDDSPELVGAHRPAVIALEREWRSLVAMSKPFSVHWSSGEEEVAWSTWESWLPWLQARPEAMQSLDVLDDLIALLSTAAEMEGLLENPWVDDLISRGVSMLNTHWPPERMGTLPWLILENRPALRILARAIVAHDTWDETQWTLIESYLRLNPGDNHGFRGVAVNELLNENRDEEALELCQRYPEDLMVEIVFGRVLALYRMGQQGAAINVLQLALQDKPKVMDYLLRDKISKPRIDLDRVALGGADEAWLYRDAMRMTWIHTVGLVGWLKPLVRKLNRRR
jgi:tetratricopeptide (TPR) repeat protein